MASRPAFISRARHRSHVSLSLSPSGILPFHTGSRRPFINSSLGPLNIEKKERKQAERKPRKTKAQLALEAPSEEEEVEQLNHEQIAQDDKATARMIMVTEKCLEEATALDEETGEAVGMNLFKFFINPDDFAQSVENLFYLSFLSMYIDFTWIAT